MEELKKPKVERVMVYLRIRPLSENDISRYGQISSIEYTDESRGIVVVRKDYDKKTYNFDSVFDGNSRQESIYNRVALPVVNSVIEGYNGTIFSYGQTGTGKTFTMIGSSGDYQGIIPRSANQIFSHIQSSPSHAFTVKVGFLQIYMEMLQDLINPNVEKQIRIREDPEEGMYLSGMTWTPVNSAKNCMELMYQGDKNRNTAFTSMNSHSSRSHAVYMLRVEKRAKYTIEQLEELEKKGEKPDQSMTKSVLYLVDLAGSERVSKSKAAGNRLDEAKNINLGLLALGNCIQALSDKKAKYVPFRDSKLTRLLEDSLGGNSKTSLVVTIGPSIGHYQESVSSLLFGTRAMKVENRPELNISIDYKALCAQLQAELDRINDSNSMWTIERQHIVESISKANVELENLNSDKTEMLMTLEDLKNKNKEVDTAAVEQKPDEIGKIVLDYEEKLRKKETEYKKGIDEYEKINNKMDQDIAQIKTQIEDLKSKKGFLKNDIKKMKEELEKEKNDRQSKINQLNSDIEDLQRALEAEKSKKEKEIIAQTLENKPDSVAKYEEIIKTNEENFAKTIENYEQNIIVHRENLNKMSLERDDLVQEKLRLQQKLSVLSQKASHIAKESAKIKNETGGQSQEVRELKEKNEYLQKQLDELNVKLQLINTEKAELENNVRILSKIHQELTNNDKTKTAQLKFITEEVYMTMKNMEKMSIRFQEKLLYFITQKAQNMNGMGKNYAVFIEKIREKVASLKQEFKTIDLEKEECDKKLQESLKYLNQLKDNKL